MKGPTADSGRDGFSSFGRVVEAIQVEGPSWSVDGDAVLVPEGVLVHEFVVREIIARVEGKGPWLADVCPAGGTVRRLLLGVDGSVSLVDAMDESPQVPTAPARSGRFQSGRRGPGVLVGLGAVVAVAAVVSCVAVGVSSLAGPAPASSATQTPGAALWSVPEGVVPVSAAGSVVAGVDREGLVLLSGQDGSRIPVAGTVKVTDTSLFRAGAGGGLSVVDVGGGSGAAVLGGTATAYEDKGALLTRGPVPVLVGGTTQSRKFYVFRDGKPAEVEPPSKGAGLFGGLADGGSAWAVAGGKVTYVPAQGAARTVSLTAPAAGASVTSWVAVTEKSATVIWQAGTSRILAVHATGPGATGEAAFQRGLAEGEDAAGDSGKVLLGTGAITAGVPDRISAVVSPGSENVQAESPACPDPVVAGPSLWCAADGGDWSGQGFTVPGKPIAAGDGFVLVTEGEGQAVVPGPKP